MRLLGIDYGTKRVGIAVSDELKMIAQPLEFVLAHPFGKLVERLKTLIVEKEVEQIVVGMPVNMDGSYGPAAEKVERFIQELREQVSVPISTYDERLTSYQADRVLIDANVSRRKRKQKTDKMAAALLLQDYLDSHGGNLGLD